MTQLSNSLSHTETLKAICACKNTQIHRHTPASDREKQVEIFAIGYKQSETN